MVCLDEGLRSARASSFQDFGLQSHLKLFTNERFVRHYHHHHHQQQQQQQQYHKHHNQTNIQRMLTRTL